MAMANNQRPEKLRQEIIARNRVGMVYQQIREHKTMDVILAKAAVKELPLEEYNKLMGEQSADKSASKAKGGGSPSGAGEAGTRATRRLEKKPAKKAAKKSPAKDE